METDIILFWLQKARGLSKSISEEIAPYSELIALINGVIDVVVVFAVLFASAKLPKLVRQLRDATDDMQRRIEGLIFRLSDLSQDSEVRIEAPGASAVGGGAAGPSGIVDPPAFQGPSSPDSAEIPEVIDTDRNLYSQRASAAPPTRSRRDRSLAAWARIRRAIELSILEIRGETLKNKYNDMSRHNYGPIAESFRGTIEC